MQGFLGTLGWLFAILALSGSVYEVMAARNMGRFVRASPLRSGHASGVSLLKPLHGAEPLLFENLSSFCVQDYGGPVQIVLGVTNPDDPSLETVARLKAAYPALDIVLVVNGWRHG